MAIVSLGSISHGTLRDEDLIPAFVGALEEINDSLVTEGAKEYGELESVRLSSRITNLLASIDQNLIREEEEEGAYYGTEESGWDIESLSDLLNEFSPAFVFFGSHPGDESDFGFWFDSESMDSAEDDGTLVKVEAGDEWPEMDEDVEYVAEVSDHGNVTILRTSDKQPVLEVV